MLHVHSNERPGRPGRRGRRLQAREAAMLTGVTAIVFLFFFLVSAPGISPQMPPHNHHLDYQHQHVPTYYHLYRTPHTYMMPGWLQHLFTNSFCDTEPSPSSSNSIRIISANVSAPISSTCPATFWYDDVIISDVLQQQQREGCGGAKGRAFG